MDASTGLLMREAVGENIDALVTLDLRGYGVARAIYRAARSVCGGPLCMSAAEGLAARVAPGDVVLIATGFVFPPWGKGEIDGVPGSAAIARALALGFGAKSVVLCESEIADAVGAVLRAAGLLVYEGVEGVLEYPHSASVMGISKDPAQAVAQGSALISRTGARVIISVERPGRNQLGVYHMGNGVAVTELAAKVDPVFEQMRAVGGFTLAIGDLGNELGMGNIAEAVKQEVPFGGSCACGCGGGIAAAVPSDACVVSAVSDWGAYGLVAALSYLSGKEDVLHSPDLEVSLLLAARDAGLIDGSGWAVPAVDGVGVEYNAHLVAMLRWVVEQPVRTSERFAGMFQRVAALKAATAPDDPTPEAAGVDPAARDTRSAEARQVTVRCDRPNSRG